METITSNKLPGHVSNNEGDELRDRDAGGKAQSGSVFSVHGNLNIHMGHS
jgi:hypothetical protein